MKNILLKTLIFLLASTTLCSADPQPKYFTSQEDIFPKHITAVIDRIQKEHELCRPDGQRLCMIQDKTLHIGYGTLIQDGNRLVGAKWLTDGVWHNLYLTDRNLAVLEVSPEVDSLSTEKNRIVFRVEPDQTTILSAHLTPEVKNSLCLESGPLAKICAWID